MKTFKVTSQEYSISYKDEEPIGKKKVCFEEYEDVRDIAIAILTGYSTEKDAREYYADEELENLEDGVESVLEALKSDGGLWWNDNGCEDMYYGGRPEPYGGYGASGTFCTYEEVKSKDVKKEKVKTLKSQKKKKLEKISKLTTEIEEIEIELEQLS